jgi:voltage-gated sodium channel
MDIFLATFIIINLIIAIVVDAMNEMKEDEHGLVNDIVCSEHETKLEVIKLQNDIKELKALIINTEK